MGASIEKDLIFKEPTSEDVFLFCYTSGTTGDPKAVMLTHKNILSALASVSLDNMNFTEEDSYISYLPLAHSMEQLLHAFAITYGVQIGFYNGDPLKLVEDLAVLRPTLFPSVPRLFNRIYEKITTGLKTKGGCARCLFRKGLNTKL